MEVLSAGILEPIGIDTFQTMLVGWYSNHAIHHYHIRLHFPGDEELTVSCGNQLYLADNDLAS